MQFSRIVLVFCVLACVFAVAAAQDFDLAAHEPAAAHEDVALAQVSESVEGPTGRRPTARGAAAKKDKLDIALAAIKQDIMVRNRQLEEEKNWVNEVHKNYWTI